MFQLWIRNRGERDGERVSSWIMNKKCSSFVHSTTVSTHTLSRSRSLPLWLFDFVHIWLPACSQLGIYSANHIMGIITTGYHRLTFHVSTQNIYTQHTHSSFTLIQWIIVALCVPQCKWTQFVHTDIEWFFEHIQLQLLSNGFTGR